MVANTVPAIVAGVVALATIAGATVAVVLGSIDAATYVALVGPFAGLVAGAGAHAAGASQANAAASSTSSRKS